MRKIYKFFIIFFSFTALFLLFSKLGEPVGLPSSDELVWKVNNSSKIPINWNHGRVIQSKFFNIFALHTAARDPAISKLNIILPMERNISLVYAQELLSVIAEFKKRGKKTIVWIDSVESYSHFLIMIAADEAYATIQSGNICTFSEYTTGYFQANKLKKEEIDYFGLNAGEFKGGADSLRRAEFGYYVAANLRAYLEDILLQKKMLTHLLTGASFIQIEQWLKQSVHSFDQAIQNGWIKEVRKYEPKENQISIEAYTANLNRKMQYSKNYVAVLSIDFGIGGRLPYLYANIIKQIALDNQVSVIVLYLDCPGGSMEHIEVMTKALEFAKSKGKYVIALVDYVAASGGYWIASCADKIFTRPAALVGSVGVYSQTLNYKQYLENQGIDSDTIYTRETPEESKKHFKMFLKKNILELYDHFKKEIQTNRSLDQELVDDLARGQIYSGIAAYKLGLIDSLDGYVGVFDLIYAYFGKQNYQFLFVPNYNTLLQYEKMVEDGE